MQYRHLYPMVRILMPFMAGIILCTVLSATTIIPIAIWIILLLLAIAAGFIPVITKKKSQKWIFGLLVSVFLFVSGFNSVIFRKEILSPTHFSKTQTQGIFIARVSEPLQEKDHSYKTILKVEAIKIGNKSVKAEGRILTYFAKDSLKKPPSEGSLITLSANIQEIEPPQNPGAFNYRKYMASNNVYHQVYLNDYSWKKLENPKGFSILIIAHKVSDTFIHILNENGLKGREFSVASALILGQMDMLDNETMQAYSGSGVMHILSVSGLHVGVIYIIISFLLGFMKKKGGQLYLKTFVILTTIWAYAILTGLSPSVMRAAAMFTFISIGNASNRHVHIINSLSVSAIFLLLINPLMISNIGFQLSYLAILGIVFINKPIADLWEPRNRVTEYIWELIAVSLAAQLATAPLAMLYFHQFPSYFIPANLVAIPVSFLAIYSGVAVLATSFITTISNFLGIITNYLLLILNTAVAFIEKLPYSVIHFNSIFTFQTVSIYLIIILIMLFVYFRKKELLFALLGLGLIFSISLTFTELKRQRQQKIVFYSTGKQTSVGFINGKQQTLVADSLLILDKKANKFQLDGAKTLYGISMANAFALDTVTKDFIRLPENLNPLYSLGGNFLFHDKRLIMLSHIPEPRGNYRKLNVDYLLIRQNPKFRIDYLTALYNPGMIIFDGSNSVYKTEKWVTECKKAGIKAYSIKDSGAFIVDL